MVDDPSLFVLLCFCLGNSLDLKFSFINLTRFRGERSVRHLQGVLEHTVLFQPYVLVGGGHPQYFTASG